MKFNLKYLTPLFSLMATIIISSCSDKTMFKREIKKCAKVSKPGLLSVYQWQNNFHYMYQKANLDSILTTTDTIYVIIKISLRYSSPFYVELFAKEWEYYLWGSHLSESLQKCYESNINNDRLLLFLLNREDLSCLSDNDKYLAKEERRMSILMLCTKDSKGKLKREIICN
jgi:hypothetical protein